MKNMRLAAAIVAVLLSISPSRPCAAETNRALIERYGLQEAREPISKHPGWRRPKLIVISGLGGIEKTLEDAFPDVEFIADRSATAASRLNEIDAVIGWCSPELLTAGKSIRWVQTLSAGVEDCVSIPAITERNIVLTNAQRMGGPVIAEHVIGMMLTLTRGLDVSLAAQRERAWTRSSRPRVAVAGKTMLVVGLGGIGTEVARQAHALGMRVTATRNSNRTGPDFVAYVGLAEELAKLAAEADVIVNTAPLTPQTTGLFNAALFAKLKRTAYFINVARGGSVVTADLTEALNKHTIAGAALDVTDPEPLPPSDPLWSAPNLIITPHVSNDSDFGIESRLELVKENVRRYIAGEKLLSVVDVSRGY